jgi:hypothetical protein
MLTEIITHLFPNSIASVVRPYKEALEQTPPINCNEVLNYANSLRNKTKPSIASETAFTSAMTAWKGWKAPSMAGIAAFLKSQGFHEVAGKTALEFVDYESGVRAKLGGDPCEVERLEASVLFFSDKENGPLHRVSLRPDSGTFSIDQVVTALEEYKEKLKWFRTKRR